jgi:hypothetical protein
MKKVNAYQITVKLFGSPYKNSFLRGIGYGKNEKTAQEFVISTILKQYNSDYPNLKAEVTKSIKLHSDFVLNSN